MKPKISTIPVKMTEAQIKQYVASVTSGKRQPNSEIEKIVTPSLLRDIRIYEETKMKLIELEKRVEEFKSKIQLLDGGINAFIGLLVEEEKKRLNSSQESEGE